MNQPSTIKTSIYWQEYILRTSKNPAQRERAKRAIIKLQAELRGAYASKT
jgi:hypothetical protein